MKFTFNGIRVLLDDWTKWKIIQVDIIIAIFQDKFAATYHEFLMRKMETSYETIGLGKIFEFPRAIPFCWSKSVI